MIYFLEWTIALRLFSNKFAILCMFNVCIIKKRLQIGWIFSKKRRISYINNLILTHNLIRIFTSYIFISLSVLIFFDSDPWFRTVYKYIVDQQLKLSNSLILLGSWLVFLFKCVVNNYCLSKSSLVLVLFVTNRRTFQIICSPHEYTH